MRRRLDSRAMTLRNRLIAADVLGIAVAFGLSWLLYDAPLLFEEATWEPYPLLAGGMVAWVVAARVYGLYAQPARASRAALEDDLAGVGGLMTICAWGVILASWLSGKPDPDIKQLLAFWALAIVVLTALRTAARAGAGGTAFRRPPPLWPLRERAGRPPLRDALADCAVLFVVFTVCRRFVEEPLPADSNAWSWVLVVVSLPVWAYAAQAFGHYQREGASVQRDVVGLVLFASAGAWVLEAISPYTGEINPDIVRMLKVWTVTIATVALVRYVLRRRAASGGRGAYGRALSDEAAAPQHEAERHEDEHEEGRLDERVAVVGEDPHYVGRDGRDDRDGEPPVV